MKSDENNDLSEKLLKDVPERESIRLTLDIDSILENGVPVEYRYTTEKKQRKNSIVGIEKEEGSTMGIPGHFMYRGKNDEIKIKDGVINVIMFHCLKKQNEEIKHLSERLKALEALSKQTYQDV